MKEQRDAPCEPASDVIPLLVGRLHEAERRLHELTGEGTDRVLDPGRESRMLQEAHETLRSIADHYNAILNSTGDAMVRKSLNGIISDWNRGAEIMFGYTRAEMIGQSIQRLLPNDRLVEEAGISERLRQGDEVKPFDTVRIRKDGTKIHVSVFVSPIPDDRGCITGVSTIARDITQIKVSEARFRRLADSNVQSVFFWNMKGEITGSNDAFLRLMGYTSDDLKAGRLSWMEMTPPEYAAADQRALAEVAASGICATYEKEIIRNDGKRIPILIGAAIFEDNRDEGVCFVLDLTERIKLEQQLHQSQKMELLGQLTGGIAHDFNNLLGIIRLNLELIRERLSDDADSREMADMAFHATDRGANLTHHLLAVARQQPLQPKTVNIEALLSGMASLLRRTLGESINITMKIPADLWTTRIDPHHLQNALLNLAVNAFHAMPDGGSLIIEASNKVFDEIDEATTQGILPGSYVIIAVTDTGTGISKEIMKHVLEPFFTTKPVGKGSGLGLSMVHGFVKQSGGHLKIYSEPGQGTTVNLFLPRASGDVEQETAAHYQQILPSTVGELVLVVEDDPDLRGLTLRILKGLGYRVVQAEDGMTACAILDSVDHVDLLLTDVVLPKGMNGPELARRVRLRQPAIKVLYMSGYPRDAFSRDGSLEERAHLLTKPFSKAELAHMVRQVMDERNET